MKSKKLAPGPSRAELEAMVRSVGLRSTHARLAVLGHFHRRGQPQTHADVAAALSDLGFNSTTVYRNLLELAEVGLLSRVELGDHVWRFELAGRNGGAVHPHFLCLDCGTVSCLDAASFDVAAGVRLSRLAKGSPIGRVTEVLLKGHCNQCR
ncbi:MAG TPA: transcriptional repressor [Pirellulales bacterium]|jgi:Fur family ferric uptake transcriptional regulator|nr:transcriptional repressor [Pirellulales bacterium]